MWVACIEHFSCNLYYIPNGQTPIPKTCRTLKAEPGRNLQAARVGRIRLKPIAVRAKESRYRRQGHWACQRSRIRGGCRYVSSGQETVVIRAIEDIYHFRQHLKFQPLAEAEDSCNPQIYAEVVITNQPIARYRRQQVAVASVSLAAQSAKPVIDCTVAAEKRNGRDIDKRRNRLPRLSRIDAAKTKPVDQPRPGAAIPQPWLPDSAYIQAPIGGEVELIGRCALAKCALCARPISTAAARMILRFRQRIANAELDPACIAPSQFQKNSVTLAFIL